MHLTDKIEPQNKNRHSTERIKLREELEKTQKELARKNKLKDQNRGQSPFERLIKTARDRPA